MVGTEDLADMRADQHEAFVITDKDAVVDGVVLSHMLTDIGEATPDALIEYLAQTARPITGAFHAL